MTAAHDLTTTEAPTTLRLSTPTSAEVVQLPWTALRRSEFNPRREFDDKALFELATDIYHKGVLQNLVVRPHPTEPGAYELAAGERRYRAVGLLVEGLEVVDDQGGASELLKVPDGFTVPCRVQPMTDQELVEIAITENFQREDVTPLEEADGFSRLVGLGMKPDEIAVRSGREVRLVEQRLTLAAGLGKEGRKLLLDKKINVAQAQVIAQTTGELKKHLVKLVRDNPRHYSADQLRKLTTEGRILVSDALFDVDTSGLQVVEDLWGITPAYFKDAQKAQALQLAAIEAQAQVDRDSGKWKFVDVVQGSYVESVPWREYDSYGPQELRGVVYMFNVSGQMHRHEGVVRKSDAQAAEKARQSAHRAESRAATAPEDRPVRDAAHKVGQEARARVLWGSLVNDPKRCLALTVQGLFEAASEVKVRVDVAPSLSAPLPEVVALVRRWTTERPDLFQTHKEGTMVNGPYGPKLHAALMDLSTDDLLSLLAYHMHDSLHHWSSFSLSGRPGELAVHVAGEIGADVRLTQEWEVSAEYLNAYTIPQLTALAATMPQGCQPSIAPGVSKKELIARIVEVAPKLREAGWVPDVVRFTR
ncbi:ParB/RepB/Spo0J family partition protein [Deinococcus enclensis]|uniref:ParB family chromosome partitioning protein n=1 Tax=Deinococcus enclensis TaxID=1049582 RepID=A0ABT9MHP3_9DEIO|nr:ParB N-terminal domain-containing protein [Deinococcus enclensis]MDP9766108.1 ParB family chromosome partitioning protein [Deinococcus enclensis]